MPSVADILRNKGTQVTSVEPDTTVRDAARRMNLDRIGCVVVRDGPRIAGVCSERDVLQRIVAEGRDPATTTVGEIMTRGVVCCHADTALSDARQTFRGRRIRHLPVVDQDGHLEGMISIGDLNAWELDGQANEIQHLHEYLYGSA